MTRHLIALCALGLLGLTGCSQAPAPVADNREAEARALQDGEVAAFLKDWSGKDADRIAAHYTDDANVMVPNFPVMTGKETIAKNLKDVLADPNWSLNFQVAQVEVSKGGDLGYARGTYVNTASDMKTKKSMTEKGRFLTVFRKEADGTWKAVQDINNAEAPAEPTAK